MSRTRKGIPESCGLLFACEGHCKGGEEEPSWATVYWYDEIFTGGRMALCDDCAFSMTTGILMDVLCGGRYTLGQVIDRLVSGLVRQSHLWAMKRNPWLKRTVTEAEERRDLEERRKRANLPPIGDDS